MIRVMYKSRKNNKKVAQAMAKALGVEAESIDGAQEVKADLLFLGCAVLGGNARPEMERFVEGLDSGSVSRVALFSSNGYGTDQFAALREKLKAKGIEVEAGAFSCKGSAFIFKNMGKPAQEDLEAAKRFALSVRDGRRS